jgi:hypothetical protein
MVQHTKITLIVRASFYNCSCLSLFVLVGTLLSG